MNIFVAHDMNLQIAFQKACVRAHALNPPNGVTADLPALSKSLTLFLLI